ncbi:CAAX prenyl protease-related protein [Salidesulfovibrio brasiliensis]|uniref:CAAX prenyl protease-related protein n=1 Tax=Salidesulfovibrio brasiliensis TaxID=221711 RepID=UPI0006CF6190|nr:CAAX prenyl protease-related protein [Salidesulfovibrio brasiliensis]
MSITQPSPLAARVAPFAVYMSFLLLVELVEMAAPDLVTPRFTAMLYPAKAAATAIALVWCYRLYTDLNWRELLRPVHTATSVATAIAVYVLWVNLDLPFATMGEQTSYDPAVFHSPAAQTTLIVIRVLGAALVVPIMEEVFWRSFLCRYLVKNDFLSVRPGTFTLFSFAATTVLFGLEHHYWLAGMIAGAAFNLVYRFSGSLAQCVLCHAVCNAALAAHVLVTRQWHFW